MLSSLTVKDLFDFFNVFGVDQVDQICATLLNGTASRQIDLSPESSEDLFLITEKHSLYAKSIDHFKVGLERVTHNQIQDCTFVVKNNINVFISLLKSEINIPDSDVYDLKTVIAFCRAKGIRNINIRI